MLETAEQGLTIDKETYKARAQQLRQEILAAQKRLAESGLSVVILINGVEGAGKGETVNRLLEWMDARGIETHAFWVATEEERDHPHMWRFWRELPAKGKIGIFFGSWYTAPILGRVFRDISKKAFSSALKQIVSFEQMLIHEDTLVVKFWMQISPDQQMKRMKEMRKDPKTRWRVTKTAKKFLKKRRRFRKIDEIALAATSTTAAPWHLIDATDKRYREITVVSILLNSMKEMLDELSARVPRNRQPQIPPAVSHNVISALDQTLRLSDADYEKQFERLQGRLARLTDKLSHGRRSLVVVFEGPDAAGKGGAIRRLISGMDARHYRVVSFAAPTDEERAHPYLWRFWRQIPGAGRIVVFDRSWYGRVLVERIEGFCVASEWERAYGEIQEFEQQLADQGALIVKFWLATTPEEQLARFKDREVTPYKQYKLTQEDWRNREKWTAYENAACEMIEKTSRPPAPWVLVEANDKNHARIKVMQTVSDLLEKGLS